MNYIIPSFTIFLILNGCNEAKLPSIENQEAKQESTPIKYTQVNFKIDLHAPTVGISDYTLITNNLTRDSLNAREIIQAKVILPLAMQRHDATLFDSVLASNFISQG